MDINFPTAPHSYFAILNLEDERSRFINNNSINPKFKYKSELNSKIVLERIEALKSSDCSASTLENMELVHCSALLQESSSQKKQDYAEHFQSLNKNIFQSPQRNLAAQILFRIAHRAENKKKLNEIIHKLNIKKSETINIWPDEEVFLRVQKYFKTYIDEINRIHEEHDVPKALNIAIESNDTLKRSKWRVITMPDSSHARINHQSKEVIIGGGYLARSNKSIKMIVAHELYGHALRGMVSSVGEAEGYALLMEQVLSSKFIMKRGYRYLAASLAYGCFGEKNDFRQTYEFVSDIMIASGKYNYKDSKIYAFNECARVFRGGAPEIPGTIYMKDCQYFKANIDMWKQIQDKKISYNDFMEVAKGKMEILT